MNYTNEINLALKEFSLGKKEIAYKKLKKIFSKDENDDQLRFNIAVIEQSMNLNERAKINYKFLVKKNNNFKAMTNLYVLYIKESNYDEALILIDKLINYNTNINLLLKDKALVLYKLKKYNASLKICEEYLKNNNDIDYLNILGLNYLAKNDLKKSEDTLIKALQIDINNSSILNSLGRVYHEKRDSLKAEKYLLKAYKTNKDSYEIINNLAGFYREEGKYKKSIDLYLRALIINPNNPTIINNLAKVYFDIGELKLAEDYCLKALGFNKNDGNVQKILSLIYLYKQNYKTAWSYFDGRLELSDFKEKNTSINFIRKKILNLNKLSDDLNILVLREQGVGDEILYGTMYSDLLNSYKNVNIECDKRLKDLFINSFPNHKNSFIDFGTVSMDRDLIDNYDVAIYAGSLGKYFRNKIENFKDGNYLKVNENLIKKFKDKLNNLNGDINVGVSWKSYKNRYADEKSLSLEDFNDIFNTRNCNFINLQYGDVDSEIINYNRKFNKNIITIDNLDLFNDFNNVASVLKNLDLFISVSNSTAHLAGSLGVKTILIKPQNHAVFHYWNQPNNKTPWYDSIYLLERDEFLNENNLISKHLGI